MSYSQEFESDFESSYYILKVEKHGKRGNFSAQTFYNAKKEREILPGGTLLRLVRKFRQTIDQKESLVLEREDDNEVQVTCRRSEIEKITRGEIAYIVSIPSLKERLEVFEDKEWLSSGRKITVGESVYVKIKDEQVEGILMFKGEVGLPDTRGIIFGVLLNEGKGTSDGMYKDIRYFSAHPNHAIFTTLNKIQTRRDGWSKKSRLRADADSEGLYRPEQPNSCLKLGERVVWMSDDGPKRGTVRWCGVLPDDNDDNVTVGVEFDEPVGSGTGKYKDTRLFYTRQSHASLVPLLGLMKEEEYEKPPDGLPPYALQMANQEEILQQQLLIDQFGKGHDVSSCPDRVTRPEGSLISPYMYQNFSKSSLPTNFQAECAVNDYRSPPISSEQANSSSPRKERARDLDLKVSDRVEIKLKESLYGVIRWIGVIQKRQTAGLEMEKEVTIGTDGTYIGKRYFICPPRKALFVPLSKCVRDRRSPINGDKKQEFGGEPTPDVEGDVPPAEVTSEKDFVEICGKHRGIQGHHNSCYLDATLFCMFYFTTVFDHIFNRPSSPEDLPEYPKVQKVLREKIVNPLRRFHYVRADNVLELRELLDKLGTVPGMIGEEKAQGNILFFYQLFMEKDENILLPTTQKLVELSFLQGNVKLREVPSCLMIQMPRFGKDFKMFHRIVPSLNLDITHILENRPRDCIVCGGLAIHECKDCYEVHGPGLNTTALCGNCVKKTHQHMKRRNHKPQRIELSHEILEHYEMMKSHVNGNDSSDTTENLVTFPHEIMELFAVICIQTSHYVSFVKCGSGKDAKWVFFDSMADRMGEQGGYNIPQVVHVPEVSTWLSEDNFSRLLHHTDDKDLPEHLRRLLCDGYMCMYQSPTVMMFQ